MPINCKADCILFNKTDVLLYVSTNIKRKLKFVCVMLSVLVQIQRINLKLALGSTFHFLQYVQRPVPSKNFISASFDHLAFFSCGCLLHKAKQLQDFSEPRGWWE